MDVFVNPRSFASIKAVMASGKVRSRGHLLRLVQQAFRTGSYHELEDPPLPEAAAAVASEKIPTSQLLAEKREREEGPDDLEL